MRRRHRIALLTAVAALAAAAAAVAAGDATTSAGGVAGQPTTISSSSGYAMEPALSVGADGADIAAWTQDLGSDPATDEVVLASRESLTSPWSTPVVVSDKSEGPDEPVLAEDASGAAVLAWVEADVTPGSNDVAQSIEAMTRASATAPWTTPVSISPAGTDPFAPEVGIDARGDVIAIWTDGAGTNPPIEAASGDATTGAWGQSQQLAAGRQGGADPQLAVNGDGDALVTWQRQTSHLLTHGRLVPTLHEAEMAIDRPAGAPWPAAQVIGRFTEEQILPGGNIWAPLTASAVLDGHGDATVIWQTLHGDSSLLEVAHRTAGRPWHVATTLATVNDAEAAIGTDTRGDLTATWTNAKGRLVAATSHNGTDWSAPTAIPGVTDATVYWLTVSANGEALVTWLGAHAKVTVATRAHAGSTWSRPTALAKGGFPQAGIHADGSATLIWPKLDPQPEFGATIEATTYTPR
jgi:hypothetical protein